MPIIETALEMKVTAPEASEGVKEQGGLLDANATAVKLNQIAVGMGGSAQEAQQMTTSVIQAASDGTEYPVPPKPAKDGKDQEMEDVMSSLESLIGGR